MGLNTDKIELIDFKLKKPKLLKIKPNIMNKKLTIFIFMIFSLFIYGQKTTFQKNINYKAKALQQNFNEKNDSLTLSSDKIISRVDIFNDDFMRSIDVNGNEAKIDLSTLPLGEYIVQARLGKKRIIMYAVRSASNNQEPKISESIINEKATVAIIENPVEKSNDNAGSVRTSYWVVYERNSRSGSHKSMRLEDHNIVSKLISRNKLELSTDIGKNNKLIIYEVYDTSKFMSNQLKNPKYFNSTESNIFNVTPYYSSKLQNSNIE